jgi:hypothetical protein
MKAEIQESIFDLVEELYHRNIEWGNADCIRIHKAMLQLATLAKLDLDDLNHKNIMSYAESLQYEEELARDDQFSKAIDYYEAM